MATYEDLIGGGEDAGKDYFEGGAEFSLRAEIEDNQYWHVHRREVIAAELSAFAPRGKLLELGCGIGTVATFLNGRGYDVDYSDVFGTGLEIAARRARERLGDDVRARRFLRMDVTKKLPLEPGTYEGMMLFDVIEHLPDDALALRNVRGALPDSGFVMVTVPAFQMLWSPWDDVEKHKRRYTRAELVDLLARTGFEVARTTYFFGPLFFAALGMKFVRTARSALGLDRRARDIGELTESANVPLLNRVMLGVLRLEQRLLERGSLPLGTSILAIARCR